MKVRSLVVALFSFFCIAAYAQESYMTAPDVAVFVPAGFDASAHLPSPIFLKDLTPVSELRSGWTLIPEFSIKDGKSIASIKVGDADLYGGGEILGDLRRNGDTEIFWNKDNPSYKHSKGKKLYQTHPWVLGLRKDGSAFGIIADNTWKSRMTTDQSVTFESEGPAFRVIVIEKESPADVLKTLTVLSGSMPLPPLWSLGYQQCRFSYYPDSRVKEIADEFRNRRIPCDVIWMDINYMQGFRIFTFDKEGFPDPKGLNDYLHQHNYKAVYMIDPGVKAEKGYFVDDQGMAGDYYVRNASGQVHEGRVWPGTCHFPDYTRPDVRRWWASLYKDFMATGIDGIWNDMNEPSIFGGPDGSMPEDCVHKGGDGLPGGPHLRYHNTYGYYMVKASREGIQTANPDKRPFILSRSNFLGGQRYAATWTGDNSSTVEHMKMSIPMTLNMGLSCQAFNGPDIGGFCKSSNAELIRQWTAMGVYFPFVRNHSCDDTINQEPFAFDKNTEDVCRTAIERRYRLMPYIYTLFEESSRTGIPVMRPVFWADPKDLDLRAEQQAFLLGPDLVVIPRWSESPALPKGGWDFFSFEDVDDGYQSLLALRPGAALPVTGVFQNTVEYNTSELTILVNPDADGNAYGTMYEDAGDGYGYKSGDYARYEFKAHTAGGRLTLKMKQVEGGFKAPSRKIRIGLVRNGKLEYSQRSERRKINIIYNEK